MLRRILIALLFVIVTITSAFAADTVSFKSTDDLVETKEFMLTGKLNKPTGQGPFPAVVMLHGCNYEDIVHKWFDGWADKLTNWGYVTLQVDSFHPRGESNICKLPFSISPTTRARDARDAKAYLAGLPFVDKGKIAVMGWSHGGMSTLIAAEPSSEEQDTPFAAAIAFYPYCYRSLSDLATPLLILIGKSDDWCPAALCSTRTSESEVGKSKHEVTQKTYPGATHCFDREGVDMEYQGHKLKYDPAAAADAAVQVKAFLAKYLQ